jgi:hypothetical protein
VGGTTDRIAVLADSVDIASTYIGQTSIQTVGTITTGTWNGTIIERAYLPATLTSKYAADLPATAGNVDIVLAHGLSIAAASGIVQVFDKHTSEVVVPDMKLDATNVTLTFSAAISTGDYRVVVIG